MITITLPDGNKKTFEQPPTGLDVAQDISAGLARDCVAMEIDGVWWTSNSRSIAIPAYDLITSRDPEGLEVMRHSAAHVMAQAVLRLYPDAKLTIGPVVEEGFYYDIDMQPVSDDDIAKIEAEMKKIIKAKLPIRRREVSKAEAMGFYKNEPYKLEMIQDLDDGTISFYEQGEFTDLVPRPACAAYRFCQSGKSAACLGCLLAGRSAQCAAAADIRYGLF